MGDKRSERGLSRVWSLPIAVRLRKDLSDCWLYVNSLFKRRCRYKPNGPYVRTDMSEVRSFQQDREWRWSMMTLEAASAQFC